MWSPTSRYDHTNCSQQQAFQSCNNVEKTHVSGAHRSNHEKLQEEIQNWVAYGFAYTYASGAYNTGYTAPQGKHSSLAIFWIPGLDLSECIHNSRMHWCINALMRYYCDTQIRRAGRHHVSSSLCARSYHLLHKHSSCCSMVYPDGHKTKAQRQEQTSTQRSLIGKKWQNFLTLGLKFNEQTIHKAPVMIWMCPHEHLTVSDIYCQNAGKKYSFDRKYWVEYQKTCWWWAEVVLAAPADAGHRWSTSSSLTSCRSTTQNLPPNLQTKLQEEL